MKTEPVASFGMPVYNGEAYIERAIESLLRQTRSDFEIVISDNGSEDRSAQIAADYARQDPRVRVLTSDRNRGASWNFRRVLDHATTPYFAWSAADDYWHERFLEVCIDQLERAPDAVSCVPEIQPVSETGSRLRGPYDDLAVTQDATRERWRTALAHPILHSAVYGLMRRAALCRTRADLAFVGSDHVLMAELVLQGKIIQVPETLAYKLIASGGAHYQSHAELRAYLGGPRRTPWLPWAAMTKELVVSVHRIRPAGESLTLLSLDAVASYITAGGWLNDLRHTVVRLRPSRRV